MWANFPVVGGFNKERTAAFDAQDTVNWYVILDKLGKKPEALMGTPGLQAETTLNTGNVVGRQLYTYRQNLYAVVGSGVYKLNNNLAITHLGNIGTSTGFVRIVANNAGQILIVDGQDGYLYDTVGGSFAAITAPGFPSKPIDAAYFEGYFVVCEGESNQVFYSGLNNGNVWDPLNFFQINTGPGYLVGVGVVHGRAFFFKTSTCEGWYNQGVNPDLPFAPDKNLIFDTGCLAAWTIQYDYGFLFWLSKDSSGVSSIFMSDGVNTKPISTPAVDNKIRGFENPSDVQSYIYKDDGHLFYYSSWTQDDATFVADITTKEWHRMEMQPHKPIVGNPLSGKVRHLSSAHAYFNDQHYVLSYKSRTLYSMSLDYGTNDGEPIRRERVIRHFIQDNYCKIQVNALRADFRYGIGNESGVYESPQAYLSISYNGGLSFIDELPAPLGKIGQYNAQTIWRQLGIHDDFVCKIAVYAGVKPIFMLGGAIDAVTLKQ
jgi:hypothetical protein